MSEEPTELQVTVPGDEVWFYCAFLDLERPRGPAFKGVRAHMTVSNVRGITTGYATAPNVTLMRANGETTITVTPLAGYEDAWRDLLKRVEEFAIHARDRRRGVEVTASEVIERYYRMRSQGVRTNLRALAEQYGYNYSYLRAVKADYDKAGGWGSKKALDNQAE